jgi:hypothetical protein
VLNALILAAEEPSKVPFYIAGGVLAVWAVALAFMGLTRPSFPYNARGQRGVILISLVLAVVAIGLSVKTSAFIK